MKKGSLDYYLGIAIGFTAGGTINGSFMHYLTSASLVIALVLIIIQIRNKQKTQ